VATKTKSSSCPARPDEKKRLCADQIQDKGKPIGAAPPTGTAINGASAIPPEPQT